MRHLATITMLILALAITRPVAAQLGFMPAEDVYLAGIKAMGKGDWATAVKHFRRAAKHDSLWGNVSKRILGTMYRDGRGVMRDLVMAYVWFDLGGAGQELAQLRSRLATSEHELARKITKLCYRKPAKCPEYSDD